MLGALLAIGGLGLVLATNNGSDPPAATPTATSTAPEPTLTPTPTTTPAPATSADGEWTLLAGGDVVLDLAELLDFDPFSGIQPPLSSGGLALVNIEMALADGGVAEDKTYVFRAPPAAAARLSAAGIDAGNLANNHSMDDGALALMGAVASLRAAGVAPVGAGIDATSAYAPASFDMEGTRVAVIGASRVFPRTYWAAANDRPGLASAYDEPSLLAAVRAAKATHDVVVVMVHWGIENAPCPDEHQLHLGDALIDAGASVVLGSHPHVLQPIERSRGGVIAYSLGNFVWRPREGPTGETGVLEVRFRGSEVVDFRLHPHVLDRAGAPVPADRAGAASIASSITNPCLPATPTPTPSATPTATAE
jgi:poly-gamma-glutamate synthesis protein (capsule biosynthesis protein)